MKESILPHILKTGLALDPAKTALFYYEASYSYETVNTLVGRLAQGFIDKLKLQKGDVVAIQSSNTVEFALTLLACLRAGISLTPLNPALKAEEIRYQLENSEAKCFIFEGYVAEKARLAAGKTQRVVFNGEKQEGEWSFEEVYADAEHQPLPLAPDTIGLIIYTSGTTGKPKGVLLSHANIAEMLDMMIESLQLTDKDRSLLILPLFHVNAIHFTLLAVLLQGGSAVIRKRFVLEEFLPAVDRYKPTFTSGVPTVYAMLANLPKGVEHQYDLSSMRFGICGAAPVSVSLFERFESRYPIKLIEGWGLSEGCCASTLNPIDGQRKVGSIGKAMPRQQVKVVDEQGREVPVGEKGELIVKGPNVMQGYLKREDETKKTLVNGWLHTGDIGYQDEDGYFYIVDRKKDLIIRGGMNIYPKQVEEVLYQLDDVLEAAVVGVPDELYGEEVMAFVVVKEQSSLTEADIIRHCKEKMADYRCPKTVSFLKEMPKNSVGKITKQPLREMGKALMKK